MANKTKINEFTLNMKIHTFGDSHAHFGWKEITPSGLKRIIFDIKKIFLRNLMNTIKRFIIYQV